MVRAARAASGVEDVVVATSTAPGDDAVAELGEELGVQVVRGSEDDVLSRAAHTLLRRRGVDFQDSSVPLHEVHAPVVGIVSTGVLEAAARGIPSWVAGEKVPAWVREFWDRYDMRRWGGEPTPALPTGADEPSRLIAQILEGAG